MVRNLRWGYAGLFWVIMAAIVLQFFLAGWGVFAFDGLDEFLPHFIVGDLIGLAMLVGVAVAFAARVPWKTTGINAGLFLVMFLQAFLTHVPVLDAGRLSIPFDAQGSSAIRARIASSDSASTIHSVSRSPSSGPAISTKPSSTRPSMKRACSSQPTCWRISRDQSHGPPRLTLTT